MRVLLIDDHPLILSALQTVVTRLGEDVLVQGVETAQAARERLAEDADVDLLLLDLALGDANGHDLLVEFRAAYPALPVVVLSASERTGDVIRAIDAGAMGFVSKRAPHAELIEALRTVMSGGLYVPSPMLGLGGTPGDEAAEAPVASGQPHHAAPPPASEAQAAVLAGVGLTPRQTDVLRLLLQGKPNKLIARELRVSVETVKDHVAAVLRALNVSSRTQAVLVVSQRMQGSGPWAAWKPGPHA